jgi:hypothetical protein
MSLAAMGRISPLASATCADSRVPKLTLVTAEVTGSTPTGRIGQPIDVIQKATFPGIESPQNGNIKSCFSLLGLNAVQQSLQIS